VTAGSLTGALAGLNPAPVAIAGNATGHGRALAVGLYPATGGDSRGQAHAGGGYASVASSLRSAPAAGV
jgi:hypothetical protein